MSKPLVDLVVYDDIAKIINTKIESLDQLSTAVAHLDYIDKKLDVSKIQIRFLYGAMIAKIGKNYGANVVGEIAKKERVPETTLREAARFARMLECSPQKLRDWIDNRKGSGRIHWSDVQEFIGANNVSSKVLPAKSLVSRMVGRAENLIRDLSATNEAIAALPAAEREDLEEQLKSAVLAAGQEIAEFSSNIEIIERGFQNGIPRSEKYLDFIRSFPCAITGEVPAEAAHLMGKKGTSLKSSDFSCIPLDHEVHMLLHSLGEDTFQKQYEVNFSELVLNYLHRYLTNSWLTMELPT